MKKLSAVLIVLVLLVVGVGFYRGWFALSSPDADQESDKVNVNLTMDKGKIKEDAETVKKKAAELTGKVADEAKELGTQVTEGK